MPDAARDADASADLSLTTDAIAAAADANATVARDAGGESSAPVASSPQHFANLVLWLDPTSGLAIGPDERLTSWTDRSVYQHVARPMRGGPVYLPQAWKGLAAISFGHDNGDTVALRIADAPSLQWGTSDFLIAAVVRYRNQPAHSNTLTSLGLLYSKQTHQRPFPGPGLFLNNAYPEYLGTGPTTSAIVFQLRASVDYHVASADTGYNDGRVHRIVAQRRGLVLRLAVDGQLVGEITAPSLDNIDTVGTAITIGAHATDLVQQLEGEIFELLAFEGELSAAQLADLDDYLANKYDDP